MPTKHYNDVYADKFVINTGETGASVVDNLTVGGAATVAETLAVTGVLTATGGISGGPLVNTKTLTTEAGTGITGGTGTVYQSGISENGGIITTQIMIDLTGLHSTADGDIIGVDGTANPCHIGQVTAADCGTVFAGKIECFEAPAGGDPDINIYSATEATGVEDGAITDLDETALLNYAGDFAAEVRKDLTAVPAADQYLYLTAGDTTDADYTAGKFIITLYGYDA